MKNSDKVKYCEGFKLSLKIEKKYNKSNKKVKPKNINKKISEFWFTYI